MTDPRLCNKYNKLITQYNIIILTSEKHYCDIIMWSTTAKRLRFTSDGNWWGISVNGKTALVYAQRVKKKNKIRHKSVEAVGLIFALKTRKNFVFIILLSLSSVYLRPVTTSRFSTEGHERRTEGGRRQESSSDRWRYNLKIKRNASRRTSRRQRD